MPSSKKIALVFGVSGQDGAYISEFLLDKGYEVHGTSRDKDLSDFSNLKALNVLPKIQLHSTAVTDFRSVMQTINTVVPDEIYNLAAQSSVALSFEQPGETIDSALGGTLNILEAIRCSTHPIRAYFASSSECFGNTDQQPADETTPFRPVSPYGVAKAAAHFLVSNYRDTYSLFVCSGILFNHESPLRPARFVTQKIIRGVVDIAEGKASHIELGNLDISRDWGWAPEYVEAMWLMLQQERPEDYVIATGETNSLRDFVATAFENVGIDWTQHVRSNDKFLRPNDLRISAGSPKLANAALGWRAKTTMCSVVARLIEAELTRRKIHSDHDAIV